MNPAVAGLVIFGVSINLKFYFYLYGVGIFTLKTRKHEIQDSGIAEKKGRYHDPFGREDLAEFDAENPKGFDQ